MEIDANDPEKKLLLETQKGELEKIVQLINEGTNVNYQDEDGNTALHLAVRYGYLEVVKHLLKNGADINIENALVETPLDVANKTSRLNIDEIEMLLSKKVIDKSFKILENFVAEETIDRYSNSSEEESKKDPKIMEDIQKEIKIKEEKMKTCLKSLKILNEKEISNSKLTYEQANNFIFFLEAFAFQDFFVEEAEESNREFKLGIQDHFAIHIPDFKGGRRLIDELRTLVCSCSKTKISLEDLYTLMSPDIELSNFFQTLERYVTSICNNLEGRPNKNSVFVDITAILRVDETIGIEFSNDGLQEEWRAFIETIHDESEWDSEKAQGMLFTFLANISPAIEKVAETFDKYRNKIIKEFPNFDIKKTLKEIFCLNIESYLTHAEILNTIDARTDKIKLCLDYIKDVNKEFAPDGREFTYKHTNILLFTLDALTFQQDTSVYKFLKELLPYFCEDQEGIKNVNLCLYKDSNKFISVNDMKKLVTSEMNVATFFRKLEDYVTHVCNEISGSSIGDEAVSINSLFVKNITDDLGTNSIDVLKESLTILLTIVSKEEDYTEEWTHEILFHFHLNIPRKFNKEVCGLDSLRKSLFRVFHLYKNVKSIIKREFTKAVFELRSILFKYYYAKEVIEIFHRIKPGDDYNKIDADLRFSLKNIEEDFEKCYRGEFKFNISTQNETDFEQPFFQLSLNPNLEESALKVLTRQYFKYMTILDDEITDMYYEKHFNIRRVLLNEFINLKLLHSGTSKTYFEEKKDLRDSLVTFNGVKETYYNNVCQYYVEHISNQEVNDPIELSITNTILSLRRLQNYYQIPNKDVIYLYKCVVDGNVISELVKDSDLFKKWIFTESKRFNVKNLKDKIKKWFKIKLIETSLNDKIITLEVVKFISNILETFRDVEYSFNIKLVNLERAFNDEKVLTNMIIQERMFWSSKVSDNQNYGYYLFMIFKKLMNLKYTEPYIARFITEEAGKEAEHVIEKEDLIKLFEDLSDDDQHVFYLKDLLNVSCEGVDLYEIFWKKIFDMNLDSMRPIFEDPDHLEVILKHLQKSLTEEGNEKILNLEYSLIKNLNSIVLHMFSLGENDKALELVKIYNKQPVGEKSLAKLELFKAKRWELRIVNWLGVLSRRKIDSYVIAVEKQKVALEMCYELKSALDKIHDNSIEFTTLYLLNLSILAYTQHSLEDYQESFNSYESLYQRIKNFTLHNTPVTAEAKEQDRSNNFVDVIRSKKYTELLNYSSEAAEYLDILKIRVSMAWLFIWNWTKNRNFLFTREKEIEFLTESIDLFKEVYTLKRREQPDDRDVANIMWKIGFMNSSASRVKEKRRGNSREVFKHLIEGLQYYNGSYNLQKGYSITLKTTLKNIFRILHEMARNRNSYIGWEGTNAIQARLDKIRATLTDILNVTKYIKKYGAQIDSSHNVSK